MEKLDELGNALGAGAAGAGLGLLDLLQQIANAIGVSGFPASVPGNLANPASETKALNSLAEMGIWQTEQLDGLIGQFPNSTKIETPDGEVDLDLPNVSESLSEIIGMLVGLTVSNSQILHTSSKALHQAGSATQQAHLAQLFARGNAEFLGYESKPSEVNMPLAYTPGANPFQGFLNEGIAKIKGFENSDKQDLKSILSELLQAAAIIRAVYWRKLDPGRDFKEQMQERMREQAGFLDQEAGRKIDSTDWEEYLRQVEAGFQARTGDTTPYGRDATERPRIRDLSKPTDGSEAP
ncbi:MAG: hypothetical protein ICV62_16655 [Cyanobacteria bacterium Co-bin13]|nr:hypothetical protein [Cyanobacteria bacterium Co-bin13]